MIKLLFGLSAACCMLPVFVFILCLAILHWASGRINRMPGGQQPQPTGEVIGKCKVCDQDVYKGSFKDDVSKKTWDVLMLCQSCQNRNTVKEK